MISSLIFGWIWGNLLVFAIIATLLIIFGPFLLIAGAFLLAFLLLFPIARKLDEREAKKKSKDDPYYR